MELKNNRVLSIDVLRGISLFGILVVNMLSFHSPYLYVNSPFELSKSSMDDGIIAIIDIFFQASFYPLFSFLFGYSLLLLKNSCDKKGISFVPVALRRLTFLLMIGIIHAFFIWHGDILINYAVLAFLFLLFISLDGRKLFYIGTSLLLVPNILLTLLFSVMNETAPETIFQTDDLKIEEVTNNYKSGSFIDVTTQRFEDWYYVNNVGNSIFFLISIFPMFLLGAAFYKLQFFQKSFISKLKGWGIFFGMIGLLIKCGPFMFGQRLDLEFAQDALGGPILSLSYIFLITYFCEKFNDNKIWRYLQQIGKMSISNYLLQSVVATFIFYGYGLGFYGEITVTQGTMLAIFIYSIQMIVSNHWLKKHTYGPVEKLWRDITYKKFL